MYVNGAVIGIELLKKRTDGGIIEFEVGGREGIRTPDPRVANAVFTVADKRVAG